jgi:dihydrofolate synthase / folylpolyglutamate synthase
MYQRVGAAAYKPSLDNTYALLDQIGNPQNKFKSIHIAGTNGKGSSSHMIASVLQNQGIKTGLYTSPHLKDFRERIKLNGEEVPEWFVIDFTQRIKPVIEQINPSFFEITVAMAFDWFAQAGCEWAVIEVGMGGRLDSTNVIRPQICLITQISYDHMEFLGSTLEAIAGEKAGIIKAGVPVVVSETQAETKEVFKNKARELGTELYFADQLIGTHFPEWLPSHLATTISYQGKQTPVKLDLQGEYQLKNIKGVWLTLELLKSEIPTLISSKTVEALGKVIHLTGLKGRWQKLSDQPLTYCDTAHNEAGIKQVLDQIKRQQYEHLHIVWGMVREKDLNHILPMLPRQATYYFTQPNIPRALPVKELLEKASEFTLNGTPYLSVNEAYNSARSKASANDFIFIGGSTFVVAELSDL